MTRSMIKMPFQLGMTISKHYYSFALMLEMNYSSTGQNALYTSKETQNEMISSCGDIVKRKIIQRIHEACFFSIIGDEPTNSANEEQL